MSLLAALEAIAEDFNAMPKELRIEALVDYSSRVPPLPERYAADPTLLEQVEECQTPFFLAAEIDGEGRVRLHFDCPPQAPTQRAFAGILAEGLEGASPAEVLAVPQDLPSRLGLGDAISMLRLQGFHAIIARLQRQVQLAEAAS